MPDEHNTRDNSASDTQREVTREHMRRSAPPDNTRADAERLAELRAMIGCKGKPTMTLFLCDFEALFLELDARDAALRDARDQSHSLYNTVMEQNTEIDRLRLDNAANAEVVAAARQLMNNTVRFPYGRPLNWRAEHGPLCEALARLDAAPIKEVEG